MDELQRVQYAEYANNIEQYHRSIKQFCGVERCQAHCALSFACRRIAFTPASAGLQRKHKLFAMPFVLTSLDRSTT